MVNWIKTHKLSVFLAVVVGYLLFRGSVPVRTAVYEPNLGESMKVAPVDAFSSSGRYYQQPAAPQPDITDRKVVTNSYLSLVVKDVRASVKQVQTKVSLGKGYVVSSNISSPEAGEYATVTVRIPSDKLEGLLGEFRGLAAKVASENITGTDITDEYVDIEARLDRLNKTKATFEAMLDRAKTVDEILQVQREIFNVQDQIDSYKGRLAYMEGASKTSLVTIYLSTDEMSLPYTPIKTWRPDVVFKQAVRSVLGTVQGIGTVVIWVVVYSIVVVPLGALGFVIYSWVKKVRSPGRLRV